MRIDPERTLRLGALIQHGSFGRAAAQLHLTQPALSQSIALLEREIGQKLVERTASGVTPTPYGQVLYEHALSIDHELAHAARRIEEVASGRDDTLTIGTMVGGAASVVALAICKMSSLDNVDVHISEASSVAALLAQLRERTVDMAICHRPSQLEAEGLRLAPLFQTRRVACVRAQHPLAGDMTLASLSRYPFVCPPSELGLLFGFPQIFATSGVDAPHMIVCDSIYAGKEIVINSDAFALFSAVSVVTERRLGIMSIAELDIPTSYWMQLVLRNDQTPSELMTAFVDAIFAVCDELGIHAPDGRGAAVMPAPPLTAAATTYSA